MAALRQSHECRTTAACRTPPFLVLQPGLLYSTRQIQKYPDTPVTLTHGLALTGVPVAHCKLIAEYSIHTHGRSIARAEWHQQREVRPFEIDLHGMLTK